jgi:hypothetical protein
VLKRGHGDVDRGGPAGWKGRELSSSNPAVATVPASVTVAAGATSATFPVTTSAVASSTSVTITGSAGGASRSATLTVTPNLAGFRGPTANAADSGGDGNGFESGAANAHTDDTANAVDNNSGTASTTSCTSPARDRHRFFNYGLGVPANPNGTFTTIVDNTGQFASMSNPSLNIFGRVAFQADRFDALGQQIFSINTSRGGPVTTVAESNPDPLAEGPVNSSFREPSLDDLGRVAFTADILVDPTVFVTTQGVFTGPDPVADKVLQGGDMIEGVPVTSVFTCSEALNNRGKIVMTVQSENPETFEVRTFIVKATPSHVHDDN